MSDILHYPADSAHKRRSHQMAEEKQKPFFLLNEVFPNPYISEGMPIA
jgi:hypothetical protein